MFFWKKKEDEKEGETEQCRGVLRRLSLLEEGMNSLPCHYELIFISRRINKYGEQNVIFVKSRGNDQYASIGDSLSLSKTPLFGWERLSDLSSMGYVLVEQCGDICCFVKKDCVDLVKDDSKDSE